MAQKYEKLVQEDLNCGTSRTWVHAPGGGQLCATQVGLHTFARGQRAYTASWTPGSISAGSKASTTLSVPDAGTGDFVMASLTTMGDTGLHIVGNVSADDTVSVVLHNPTASAVSVSAGTVAVLIFPANDIPPSGPEPHFSYAWDDESRTVRFDGSATVGDIAVYDWDYGDGNSDLDNGVDPDHQYAADGTYTVTFTVTDVDSNVASVQATFEVTISGGGSGSV